MISLALHHLLFQPSAGAVDLRSRTRIRCFGWWPIKFAHARKRQPSRPVALRTTSSARPSATPPKSCQGVGVQLWRNPRSEQAAFPLP